MRKAELEVTYRDYVACLNNRDWTNLARFVDENVERNGLRLGIDGYRAMLEADWEQIPNLHFEIQILICAPPHIASRLRFEVAPKGIFLGLPVNGRTVTFCENAIYEFRDGKICVVWSVIDKTAIEAQLL